jgi:predicted esterase
MAVRPWFELVFRSAILVVGVMGTACVSTANGPRTHPTSAPLSVTKRSQTQLFPAPAQPPSLKQPVIEEPQLVPLPVPHFRSSVVSVPADRGLPLPLLVATHGAGGQPEVYCKRWSRFLQHRAFVLCPRGAPIGLEPTGKQIGWFYPNHHALEKEVRASLTALYQRFGSRVLPNSRIYFGFSQGATMGSLMLPALEQEFSYVILTEGGFQEWDTPSATKLAKQGSKRVLFVCGRLKCSNPAKHMVTLFSKTTIQSKLVANNFAGHVYAGPLEHLVQQEFPWLVHQDPVWQTTPLQEQEQ